MATTTKYAVPPHVREFWRNKATKLLADRGGRTNPQPLAEELGDWLAYANDHGEKQALMTMRSRLGGLRRLVEEMDAVVSATTGTRLCRAPHHPPECDGSTPACDEGGL